MKLSNKNIVLFVGNVPDRYIEIMGGIEININLKIVVFLDNKEKLLLSPEYKEKIHSIIKCDTDSKKEINKKLNFIKKDVLMIYYIFEKDADFYCEVLKNIKLENNPPIESIRKSVNKIKMRKAFYKYDQNMIPKFMLAKSKNDLELISKKIGFPCILKPAHLSKSRLVTVSQNENELKKNLNKTFGVINKVYKKWKIKPVPLILAEEMMIGKMYSVDVCIDSRQKIYFTPVVDLTTARDIGIDDFHHYARILPSSLSNSDIKKAYSIAKKGIMALGLKNSVAHIELMKTKNGWKIVEIGSRIGGYRNKMLKISYDTRYFENYFLIGLNRKPVFKNKPIAYSAVLEFFPKKEGYLRSIKGTYRIKKLDSFSEMKINSKIGDFAGFAKNGYLNVLYILLGNKNKKTFYKDLKIVKSLIEIETSKSK
ncbi:ATP-grasp domain-containing protein [Candidatus Parcubacteria bacterium]|nr:ATP-grasp domain-containing protein [Candidatus Parcubacteria bacterium]